MFGYQPKVIDHHTMQRDFAKEQRATLQNEFNQGHGNVNSFAQEQNKRIKQRRLDSMSGHDFMLHKLKGQEILLVMSNGDEYQGIMKNFDKYTITIDIDNEDSILSGLHCFYKTAIQHFVALRQGEKNDD